MTTHGRAERFTGMTVTWKGDIGGELDVIAFDDVGFEARIAVLQPHTQFGENYIRGIAETITEARRCRAHATVYEPDLFFALHWLDEGELVVRSIDYDERDKRRADREAAYRACSIRSVEHLRETGAPYGYKPAPSAELKETPS
ncbi:hypothetical protein OG339_48385 (plasmid) [Streptosporangium sp. NBC_01495]|uniref:hypothetical protein n=1 Tax=Streptosporangium sp. NBC_01495 TaxID=2903899 RepID=UPI002E37DD85|nr:hypothetical protein [Streptosporangium sp. NBC_01495]